MNLVLIAVGGALGALARYGLAGWVQHRVGFFPWGTLAVNVIGSFLLGFVFRYLEVLAVPPEWREAVTIGFLGAFTTFSTFSYEAVALAQDGDLGRAASYVAASVVLALVAVLAGLGLADVSVRGR